MFTVGCLPLPLLSSWLLHQLLPYRMLLGEQLRSPLTPQQVPYPHSDGEFLNSHTFWTNTCSSCVLEGPGVLPKIMWLFGGRDKAGAWAHLVCPAPMLPCDDAGGSWLSDSVLILVLLDLTGSLCLLPNLILASSLPPVSSYPSL